MTTSLSGLNASILISGRFGAIRNGDLCGIRRASGATQVNREAVGWPVLAKIKPRELSARVPDPRKSRQVQGRRLRRKLGMVFIEWDAEESNRYLLVGGERPGCCQQARKKMQSWNGSFHLTPSMRQQFRVFVVRQIVAPATAVNNESDSGTRRRSAGDR